MPWEFNFYVHNQSRFRHPLRKFHCAAISKNGHHCKNTTVIGEPFCWVHLLYQHHLRIKTSTIAGAGQGCFAMDKQRPAGTVVFRAGEQIIHYYGEIIDKRTLNERYGRYTAPYAVELTKNRGGGGEYEDAALDRSAAACINHPRHANEANCRFALNQARTEVRIMATKDIRNGEELFVHYGDQYWRGRNGPAHHTTTYV